MSSPIMLIDNTDDGYLYLATMAENMKINNDLPRYESIDYLIKNLKNK